MTWVLTVLWALAVASPAEEARPLRVYDISFLTGEIPSDLRPHILRARVFVGHAGWGTGQLEAELESDSWIVEEATAEDVFTGAPESLWPRVLKRMGPPYAALARIPFDPSTN